MASKKCWSSTVGTQRGTRVRVYERMPGGVLYIALWQPGCGQKRRSLGHKDRKRALQQARKIADLRLTGELADSPPLTLGVLLDKYLAQNRYNRDGSLKTDRYREECVAYAENLKRWFGVTSKVEELTPDRMEGYVRARRVGKITGRRTRTRSAQIELSFLKSAFKWATGSFENGKPMLKQNPLACYSPPSERDPRRPIIRADTVSKLLDVAPAISSRLPLLIRLMDATGRRLGSVLGLRWDDFDFEQRTIRWRSELDKRRITWVAPMPRAVEIALLEVRSQFPSIGNALVFPAQRNPSKSTSEHVARDWLLKAYERAGLVSEPGGLWHPFRRKWATERKQHPLRDVEAAGGWNDIQTLLTCYQLPDAETLRQVVDGPIQIAAST